MQRFDIGKIISRVCFSMEMQSQVGENEKNKGVVVLMGLWGCS